MKAWARLLQPFASRSRHMTYPAGAPVLVVWHHDPATPPRQTLDHQGFPVPAWRSFEIRYRGMPWLAFTVREDVIREWVRYDASAESECRHDNAAPADSGAARGRERMYRHNEGGNDARSNH